MTEWKIYRLGKIVATNKKSIGRSYPFSMIKYLDTGSITRNHIESLQEYKLSEAPSRAKRLVQEGDIIYSAVRPNQLHYGYISKFPENLVVSTGFIVISCNKDYIEPKFLYYLLTQQEMTDYLHSIADASTSAYPSLKSSDIENLEISLPPMAEQRRIAGILGAIDDKIENNRRINTNLELQAQALYKQWFVDFDFPNEDGKPYKSSGGKMVDSELGLIPEGWRVGNIGGYCKIRSGYAFKSSWWTDRGVKIIKIKNITENGVLDMSECSYVDIKHCDKASDFNGHAGDLIIAMTGATLGKVCIIPYHTTDYYINQRVGKFFLGDNPINKLPFIHCILRDENVMSEIINKGQGSAQPNISASDVETIKIVMPSYYIMDKFNLLLQSNYALWLKNMAEVNSFATLRDTLLPKLMNGEIKGSE